MDGAALKASTVNPMGTSAPEPVVRQHWPDEEPELDERPEWMANAIEQVVAAEYCSTCGIKDHDYTCCTTVPMEVWKQ